MSIERRGILVALNQGGMSFMLISEILGFDTTRVAEIIWGNRKSKQR